MLVPDFWHVKPAHMLGSVPVWWQFLKHLLAYGHIVLHHHFKSLPSAQGFNASGFAIMAPSAVLASLMPAVPLVGAGTAFAVMCTPLGSFASMSMDSTALLQSESAT
jgi:hypothetical protein